jgi:NDP-sugar pyrophosphorylase family protein
MPAVEHPRALVLAAGLGTRLRPLTDVRAKAAVPVNGEPLITRVLRWLAAHRVTDLVVNLHHRPESIARVVGDGAALGVRVRYSWEQPVLGSAGGPRHALPLLVDGGLRTFLLVNGDTVTDLAIEALLTAHAAAGALVTMAVIPNPRPERYGGVLVAADGAVTGFTRRGTAGPSFHFIGVQAVEPAVFADLPDGEPEESVNVVYPRLLARAPGSIRAFVCRAQFRDIGTPADCLDTALALAATEGPRLAGARCRVSNRARLTRTVLWDDVEIEDEVELVDCIVADGVRVPAGLRAARRAIVAAGTRPPMSDEAVRQGLLLRPF